GISNGGILTELLGCSLADRLIGIVPVAGLMRRNTSTTCSPARPISVFGIHGTSDPIADYHGVPGADGFLSFTETLAFWARLDGCSKTATTTSLADSAHDNTSVTTLTYSGCRSGPAVDAYAMKDGSTEMDAYLDGWKWGPVEERDGAPDAVVKQLIDELTVANPRSRLLNPEES